MLFTPTTEYNATSRVTNVITDMITNVQTYHYYNEKFRTMIVTNIDTN